jgi:hypothetical protein
MFNAGISKFFENASEILVQGGGEIGGEIDRANEEFRRKGMSGSPEEREQFLKKCFHAARFNMRLVLLAAPAVRLKPDYAAAVNRVLQATAQQARETGFDEDQIALYVDAHRKAYESLAEEFGVS